MSYGYYTYKKSSVIGGSWSTPFGTPFFARCGDWSLKVPMAQLRAEHDAWEQLQLERRAQAEPPQPDPIPSLPSGPFDRAEDVEQELFITDDFRNTGINLDNSGIDLDSNLDSDPLPSFPSGPFDWADDVEQELFSGAGNDIGDSDINLDNTSINLDNSGINLDSDLDSKSDNLDNKIDPVFSPIVDQVVPEGVAVVGAGTTLCAIPEEGEEEGMTAEDEASDLDSIDLTDSDSDSDSIPCAHWTDPDSTDCDTTSLDDFGLAPLCNSDTTSLDDSTPRIASTPLDDSTSRPTSTPSTDTNTTVYRIINASTADNVFSLHMVEDGTASDTSKTKTSNATTPAQELYEAIQFLGTVGLLNLDTYATVFDTAARACVAGPPFWLHDPLGDRQIVV